MKLKVLAMSKSMIVLSRDNHIFFFLLNTKHVKAKICIFKFSSFLTLFTGIL